MKRGDIVLAVARRGNGKPRPAVVVQSDLFNSTHASLIVCLLTSEIVETRLFRPTISPSPANGLERVSQMMVDKLLALPRDQIREHIGTLDNETLSLLNRALCLLLGLESV